MIRQANIYDSKPIAEISKNDLGYECSEKLVKERLAINIGVCLGGNK